MKFTGFIGPTYNLSSVNVDCQRCVNLYPEIIESGNGKEGAIAYLKSTPGLEKIATIGTGPIRLVHVDSAGNVLVVSGNKAYSMAYSGTWAGTLLSVSGATTLGTTTGPVRAASMIVSNIPVTVIVDGVMNCIWDPTAAYIGAGVVFARYDALGWGGVPTATHIAFIDGYLIFNKASTNQFYVSELLNPLSVSPLSFASAEGDPDNIAGHIANRRDLWLFNDRTIEIFSDTGNADFPFERVQGGFIEKGCLAKYSIAKIEGIVFWLGRDEFGSGVVYAAQGVVPQRISTHSVEQAIASYASPSTASAYTYQSNGHSFYVLNFTEATWVYDFATKLWHERAYTNAGVFERHRVESHAFIPAYGIHMVGDYSSGNIYKFNDSYYSDDGSAITRMRIAPHLSQDLSRLFCHSFQIDMESGVGLDGGVQGSNPQLMLDYSDDGGHTWSNESYGSVGTGTGTIGQYKKRVLFRRLGYFRDRVFRVKITDPVKVTFIGAQINVSPGVG